MTSSKAVVPWPKDYLSMLQIPKYVHEPLKSEGSIRLVRLNMEVCANVICCEISDYNLDDESAMPPYRALSYTWGTDSEVRQILLNGKVFVISRTLYDFLFMFTNKTRQSLATSKNDSGDEQALDTTCGASFSEYLWIDQISINQEDSREKSHQVSQMARIFTTTTNVIVWLDRRFESYWDGVFSHPYWHRLWVAQELVLAKAKTVYYGTHIISEEALDHANQSAFSRHIGAYSARETSQTVLWNEAAHKIDSFAHSIQCFSILKCREPRDAVYGLLALSNTLIEIDYTKPVLDIFWDAINELEREFLIARRTKERPRIDCLLLSAWTLSGMAIGLAASMMPEKHCFANWLESDDFRQRHMFCLKNRHCPELGIATDVSSFMTMRPRWRKALEAFVLRDQYCDPPQFTSRFRRGRDYQCDCFVPLQTLAMVQSHTT